MVLLGKWVGRWLAAATGWGWTSITPDGPTARTELSPGELVTEDSLPVYTLAEVADHQSPDSCWVVVKDLVFDVTPFLFEHPGSGEILLEHAGTDATTVFCDVGHSADAVTILTKYTIGVLPKNERLYLR